MDDDVQNEHQGQRAFRVEVDLGEGHAHQDIPRRTSWYLPLHPSYPLGDISFYPAKEGGITKTWPHQKRNSMDSKALWRKGTPCLEYFGSNLDDSIDSDEPAGMERLAWHGERLVEWLHAAANDTLVKGGDAMEFPAYHNECGTLLGYVGRPFAAGRPPDWATPGTTGTADLLVGPGTWSTRTFYLAPHGQSAAREQWNQTSAASGKHATGVWVATATIPYKEPWSPIETFVELDDFLSDNESSLEEVLQRMPSAAWNTDEVFLLVAAQTRKNYDQPPSRISWHGICLKPKQVKLKSRFHTPAYARQLAARLKADKNPLKWMNTWDFAPSQHQGRGSLEDRLMDAKVGIIGCGTLGTHVAEYLARGGVREFVLVDYDDMEYGNLVRHTLTASSVGDAKASAIAVHLESLHPLLHAEPIEKRVSALTADDWRQLKGCDIVFNLSADPFVDGFLEHQDWEPTSTLVRGTVTLGAEHLLLDVQHGPTWDEGRIESLRQRHGDLVRKGKAAAIRAHGNVGCHNPSFPALDYEVATRAADLVRHLDQRGLAEAQACYPDRGSCGS